MKISELLRKKILEAEVGGVINRLKINKRRNSLFFGDIFTEYVKMCEHAGHSGDMMEIGQTWMQLYFSQLVPIAIKKLPLHMFSGIMRKVWTNLGMMEDFRMKKRGDIIEIVTRGEAITGAIGDNMFSAGLFLGICNSFFNSGIDIVSVTQRKEISSYVFRKSGKKPPEVLPKDRKTYERLNYFKPINGLTLDKASRDRIFHLRENKIFFRGRPVYTVENTLYHLVGEKNIMAEEIAGISYRFFNAILDKGASDVSRLGLLKNLLHAMGWGLVKIITDDEKTVFEIMHPPFGLQKGADNWTFLINSILGFMRVADRRFAIESVRLHGKTLRVVYSKA